MMNQQPEQFHGSEHHQAYGATTDLTPTAPEASELETTQALYGMAQPQHLQSFQPMSPMEVDDYDHREIGCFHCNRDVEPGCCLKCSAATFGCGWCVILNWDGPRCSCPLAVQSVLAGIGVAGMCFGAMMACCCGSVAGGLFLYGFLFLLCTAVPQIFCCWQPRTKGGPSTSQQDATPYSGGLGIVGAPVAVSQAQCNPVQPQQGVFMA